MIGIRDSDFGIRAGMSDLPRTPEPGRELRVASRKNG